MLEKTYNFDKFRYKPIDYEACFKIYEQIQTKLQQEGLVQSKLYKNTEKIVSFLPKVFERADKSCCGQIKANGYYSYSKLVYKFLKFVNYKLIDKFRHSEKELEEIGSISQLLLKLNDLQIELIEKTNLEDEKVFKELEDELNKFPEFHRHLKMYQQVMVIKEDDKKEFNSFPLFTPRLDIIFKSINEAINQQNTKDKFLIYLNRYFMYWLDAKLVSFFKLYMFAIPFLRVRLYKYASLIFNEKSRAKTLNKILSFPTVNFPFEFWNVSESRLALLFIKYQTHETKTKSKELYVPSQTSIIINKSPIDKLSFTDANKINFNRGHKIRCKYIYPKNFDFESCNRLMIHFHGGGFFSQRCDSHEIYLKCWANYNKIPILTADYKVKEPFPNGLKDCLDVYLWLRQASQEEIGLKLGYLPKKIVITGDSAGGNFALAISLILNDLRTIYKTEFKLPIQMPDGMVLIYAPLLINANLCPSRMLGSLDTLVPTGVQLVILYGISGFIDGLKPNTAFQVFKSYLFPFLDPKPWFECSPEKLKKQIDFLNKFISPQYLTPLFYQNYRTLTDVPLHLISAEFCTFLDESITLAKLWKGKIKVDVVENLCHGFLNLKFVGENVNNASIFCGQKITEMFEN